MAYNGKIISRIIDNIQGKGDLMGVIFVAGVYGVGKSTLCQNLSVELEMPAFSAGDLISAVNGEIYGVNKNVTNKFINQDILSQVVHNQLQVNSQILLAGHFCIFDREYKVDCLPESIFEYVDMESILLLEADINRIIENLSKRDKKNYTYDQLSALAVAEQEAALRVAKKTGCNFLIHKMQFNKADISACISKLKGGHN